MQSAGPDTEEKDGKNTLNYHTGIGATELIAPAVIHGQAKGPHLYLLLSQCFQRQSVGGAAVCRPNVCQRGLETSSATAGWATLSAADLM